MCYAVCIFVRKFESVFYTHMSMPNRLKPCMLYLWSSCLACDKCLMDEIYLFITSKCCNKEEITRWQIWQMTIQSININHFIVQLVCKLTYSFSPCNCRQDSYSLMQMVQAEIAFPRHIYTETLFVNVIILKILIRAWKWLYKQCDNFTSTCCVPHSDWSLELNWYIADGFEVLFDWLISLVDW